MGRYRLCRELGAGAMGVVYEAYDPELERPLAVKLLRTPRDRERLLREARALAKLSHPNVVAVYDVGTFEEHAFIALELVEGVTLRQWLAERPRELEEILSAMLQAGRGLAAAHAAGFTHRDFKPENVIVGRDGRVRVLDFGIVSALDANRAAEARPGQDVSTVDAAHALTSAPPGTPAYMSPEQLRGEAAEPTADQYSFSVVLWELLFGARPFAPESLLDLMRDGVIGELRRPPGARAVPRWLMRVLERGLGFDPAVRFASMPALLEALEAGLARQATEAHRLGRRYELLPVTASSPAATARALDRFTGRLVTIQRFPAQAPDASSTQTTYERLARSFARVASLRHPHLLGLLDFGLDRDGEAYLVLDVRDVGEDLFTASRRPAARAPLEYLIQLLQALAHLHQHQLYLGTLESALALVFDDELRLSPQRLFTSAPPGPFCAPEVVLGAPPSAAGDLYAFAAFARELLSPGAAPSLAGSSLADPPALTHIEPRVALVLEALLHADPSARSMTAEEAERALRVALSHSLGGDGVDGFDDRQSRFLYTPFLGRDAELALLEAALRDARQSRGSAWLLTGESGAGKSRLLEELAGRSVACGALVLRGQEEVEGGSPYRLFREVLHGLSLLTDLEEFEASVLSPVLPHLSEQLGHPIAPAPELDARSTHARLLTIVESILGRQAQPLVLLLEDAQWARSDSLDLLRRLAARVSKWPVLIVATARDDEPQRPESGLDTLRTIRLGRLSTPIVAQLAEAMIGPRGQQGPLLDLLLRESEGNAFFLVEVVRALAEEAGSIERVAEMALPERVFAGRVQNLVQRRLRTVPEAGRALLETAAVVGRRLDPKLMHRLMPGVDVDLGLAQCLDAAVLERSGDALRFRHDKLRQGLLATLNDGKRRRLHAKVAAAMELEHGGDPEHHAALAHHFGQAAQPDKESHYAVLAGEYALLNGALSEAVELLERALDGLSSSADAVTLGRVCCTLSDAYYFMTDMPKAMSYAARACRAVGFGFPVGKVARVAALFWQLALHIGYRLLPKRSRARSEAKMAASRVASIATGCAACVSISLADATGVVLFSLMAWNLAERARYPALWASGILGYGLAVAGFPRLASSYFTSRERGERALEASYPVLKTSFLLGTGELAAAEALAQGELELIRHTGFRPAEAFNWFILGYCAFYRGEHDQALHCFTQSVEHEGTRANFAPGLALVRCLMSPHAELEASLSEALAPVHPAAPRSIAYAVLALIHTQNGDRALGLEAADTAVALAAGAKTFGYAGAAFFTGVFAAYLADLEQARRDGAKATRALRQLRRVARHCRAWARAFRIGRPLALLYDGKIAWLEGRAEQARSSWQESLSAARSMNLGLYVTLAERELETASASPATRRERASNAT